MRKIVPLALLVTSCSTLKYTTFYTTHENKQEKVLQGVISREVIESDTTFKWFPNNYKHALANVNAVDVFRKTKANLSW